MHACSQADAHCKKKTRHKKSVSKSNQWRCAIWARPSNGEQACCGRPAPTARLARRLRPPRHEAAHARRSMRAPARHGGLAPALANLLPIHVLRECWPSARDLPPAGTPGTQHGRIMCGHAHGGALRQRARQSLQFLVRCPCRGCGRCMRHGGPCSQPSASSPLPVEVVPPPPLPAVVDLARATAKLRMQEPWQQHGSGLSRWRATGITGIRVFPTVTVHRACAAWQQLAAGSRMPHHSPATCAASCRLTPLSACPAHCSTMRCSPGCGRGERGAHTAGVVPGVGHMAWGSICLGRAALIQIS